MKATFTKLVSKKGILTKTLIITGLILVTLPSCKHKSGGCDAYQGSTRSNIRSTSKFKHHHASIINLNQIDKKA